ncbi:hypothetical protein PHJA_002943000 [Phtheirospermum japonicum]|uniref:Uncharacterized protein n=1 Tax=Phtheirospermum japonicum TaxID=374723 RepID=A0A830D9R4_9LAMI|nr:hypothetical protein PHJA_002943000 [Phtheirospermum japonicum]
MGNYPWRSTRRKMERSRRRWRLHRGATAAAGDGCGGQGDGGGVATVVHLGLGGSGGRRGGGTLAELGSAAARWRQAVAVDWALERSGDGGLGFGAGLGCGAAMVGWASERSGDDFFVFFAETERERRRERVTKRDHGSPFAGVIQRGYDYEAVRKAFRVYERSKQNVKDFLKQVQKNRFAEELSRPLKNSSLKRTLRPRGSF